MAIILKIKTVMLGEAGSGKSCVINRLIHNEYDEFGSATIGAQFLTKDIGENNKLEIWDTAGQERYRALIPMYLRNAHIICLVISLEKNLDDIEYEKQYWLNYLGLHNSMYKFHKKILLYNKCDLNPDFKLVDDERFDNTCIVSCKTNVGIDIFINSLESSINNLKDSMNKNMDIIIHPIKVDSQPNKNEKKGMLEYTYSLSQNIMKCTIL